VHAVVLHILAEECLRLLVPSSCSHLKKKQDLATELVALASALTALDQILIFNKSLQICKTYPVIINQGQHWIRFKELLDSDPGERKRNKLRKRSARFKFFT
jgi:hypothetical protein